MERLSPRHFALVAELTRKLGLSTRFDLEATEDDGVVVPWHLVEKLITKLDFAEPAPCKMCGVSHPATQPPRRPAPDTSWAKSGPVKDE